LGTVVARKRVNVASHDSADAMVFTVCDVDVAIQANYHAAGGVEARHTVGSVRKARAHDSAGACVSEPARAYTRDRRHDTVHNLAYTMVVSIRYDDGAISRIDSNTIRIIKPCLEPITVSTSWGVIPCYYCLTKSHLLFSVKIMFSDIVSDDVSP
jgi:hypothetical protein